MTVLVPVDSSDNSFRALAFAAVLAERLETDLHTVHIATDENATTAELLERIEVALEGTPFEDEPEVVTEKRGFRPGTEIGTEILELVENQKYEHIVMGHHGGGIVGRAILGSATDTVMDGTDVPLTVVP
ncbi:universal stress protein [Halolamina sp.]|uniref:universal stress protein n=1 Tax=Halolamina sp. TaxID=1940283 RepID=UPI0012FDE712